MLQTGKLRPRVQYIDAVRAQGACLITSRARIVEQLAVTDLSPWRKSPLVLAGMGASYHAIATALPFYRSRLARPVWGYLASDFLAEAAIARAEPPAVIAVSQSGRSREIVDCLRCTPARARLGLTAQPGAVLGALLDTVIDLAVPNDSAVRVIGYSASVQALILIAAALAETAVPSPAPGALTECAQRCIRLAERATNEFLDAAPRLAGIDLVGTAEHAGTAAQGALLLREACRLPAAAYDTYQYLHGPIEAVDPGALLVAIGSGREIALARSLGSAGAKVLLVTESAVESEPNLWVLRLPTLEAPLSWLPAVLAVQVLAWEIAQRLGLSVGSFRHHQNDTKIA